MPCTSHPRNGTYCPTGCAIRKPLTQKRFLQLSTETVHRYLLLLFLYTEEIKKTAKTGRANAHGCLMFDVRYVSAPSRNAAMLAVVNVVSAHIGMNGLIQAVASRRVVQRRPAATGSAAQSRRQTSPARVWLAESENFPFIPGVRDCACPTCPRVGVPTS